MTVCSLESQGSNQKSDSVQILARLVIDPKSSRAHEEATVSGKSDDDTKPGQIFEQKRETFSSEVDTLKGRQSLINNTHLVDSSQLYHHPRLSYIPLPSTNTFSTRVIVVDCSLTRRPSEDRQGARQTTPSGNTNSRKRTLVTQFNHTRRHPPHLRIPTECCRFGRTTRELLAPRAHGRSHTMKTYSGDVQQTLI
ncbi:SubName: Full=Uncharacterized protein {ECO:0000313/EMBL:CCA76908.1} [Serendipita indica DSM 11827]|nr:SubName: Full=Uncharacterized protein {ECO:0000313/EMBL:CCA76908.1} [Serendipita indica DSM 11827]